MDPQLAALMARRRRKADGIESERAERKTAPLEDDDIETSGEILPVTPSQQKQPLSPIAGSPQKPSSVSSLKDALYSPSLLGKTDGSSEASSFDKSKKDDDAIPLAPSLSKKASSTSSPSKETRSKRPKSGNKSKVTEEEISELDDMIMRVDSTRSEDAGLNPDEEEASSKKTSSQSPTAIQRSKSSKTKSKQEKDVPRRRKSNDNLDDHSGQKRASRRRSNETEKVDTTQSHPRMSRRRSNETENVTSEKKSPGRHKATRRGTREGDEIRHSNSEDNIEESTLHRKASRRKSNESLSGEGTKSPGRAKHQRRRGSNDDNIRSRSSEGSRDSDASKSPGAVKPHRRKGPSRTTSRSQSKTSSKSSSRPSLPSNLENEISESAAARISKSKLSSPRHKMPTTLEEELISATKNANQPVRKRSAFESDEEEASLSGDDFDQAATTKNRSKRDSSNKQRSNRKTSRKPREEEEHEEYEEDLRDKDKDIDFKPNFNDESNKSEPSMNLMFEDSTNFETDFTIDLAGNTNHTTKSKNNSSGGSLSAASAFQNDGFSNSFAMDFGSFSNANNKASESDTDAFGFSAAESASGTEELAPTTFSNNMDFGADFGGDWNKSQTHESAYDASPIEKPPINQAESMSTKIRWIAPKTNLVMASTPKNQNPPPVSNPLNGNLIVCRPKSSGLCDIVEWSPSRQIQVKSVSILTTELKQKVIQKYGVTPETVDTVWAVSAGIKRSSSTEGVTVAALIDMTLLGDRNKEVLRLIAVWDWGQSGPCLQSVMSPPSGSDFTYDTKSLKVADGCVFVAGASAKGPCVFLNKPTVRETWSANFIAKNTDLRISSMSVTNASKSPPDPVPKSGEEEGTAVTTDQRLPYLAVALNDGSLSVWTYEAALKLTEKTKDAVRKLLFPVCRLHAIKFLKDCEATPWSAKDRSDSEKSISLDASIELGACTHLEWIPYKASAHKQLLLLAAAFQGALCLYHVALPKVQDKTSGKKEYVEIKPPTDKTNLSQTISLKPFCFSKWTSTHHKAFCAFVDLGPHVPPSLVVLMKGSYESPDYARVTLVTCPMEAKIGEQKSKSQGDPLSFYVWDTHEFKNAKATNLPRGLIHSSLTSTRGVLYYTDMSIQELEYRTNTRLPLGTSGVGSVPSGLTTSGSVYWADSKSTSGVGYLNVYTTYHCERFKSTLSQDPSTPTLLEWTNPGRRHWLVQTFPGDSRDSESKIKKAGEEIFKGGAQSTLVCELVSQSKMKNLYPYRLTRSSYSPKDELHVAVWFRPLYGNADSKVIGLIERDGDGIYGLAQLIEGRDIVFLPPSSDGTPKALVVSSNGGTVSLWKRNTTSKTLASPWKKDSSYKSYRPILGVDPKSAEEYVELRQYVLTYFQNQLSVIAIASGLNNKFCLIAGPLVKEDDMEDWSKVLPNMKENHVLWLDEREQISVVVPLPCEGSIQGGLGVVTTQRILIVSTDLKILASINSEIPPASLVPMGSFTVAYISPMDHKLRYLSGLPKQVGRSGVMASLSNVVPTYYTPWLAGIRPDRFLYNVHQSGTRSVERGQSGYSFLLPISTTRPALLLEPMLANAIATGGDDTASQQFFRTVLEKFGRKVATMSHSENEGIGNSGAGITPRVFELLEHYDLKSAASWLLTGTISFDRSANSRLLPSYLPVNVKTKAAFNTDTHLHLIANGDQYLTEYIKSPDNNMSSTLPRPTDPAAALCGQFGMSAIEEGKVADAMKMLDISGSQTSEAMILQMAMALQLDPSKNSQAIIDASHQKDSLTGKIPSAVASLAALASELKKGDSPSVSFHHKWLQSLAPSVQRCRKGGRHRSRLLGESSLANMTMAPKIDSKLFNKELPESKLVWNEGPSGEKENLLMLDNMGEWFGRSRPVVFGKEGAKRAEERGASTLAGILHSNDEDSFGGDTDDDFKDGWVDGVGEGLKGKNINDQFSISFNIEHLSRFFR